MRFFYRGILAASNVLTYSDMTAVSFSTLVELKYLTYAMFLRYKALCPATWPHWRGVPADGVETLVQHLGYQPDEYKMGR